MSEQAAPAEIKPAEQKPPVAATTVRADVLALRLLIRNTRKLMTYTVMFAVLFIVIGGFVDILTTLPKFANDALLGLAFTDLGLFLAGMFIMAGIINDYSKKLYALNRPLAAAVASPAALKVNEAASSVAPTPQNPQDKSVSIA